MLFIHQKYKPMMTKENVSIKEDSPLRSGSLRQETKNKQDVKPIQGKGLNKLIEKVKDMKVKELTKKRTTNSNSKISFN